MSNKDIKGSVKTQFGNVAANYSTSKVHAAGADLNFMVERADLPPDALVLDAGCGAGHTALAFAPHVKRVIAYDLTPAMLEQVEKLATERGIMNVETRLGDVEQLPFEDAIFDAVVSRYSAHHWVNPQAALVEFARVLKPGGKFILSDIVSAEDHAADTFLQTIELLRDPSHVRDHRVSQWVTMFESAGFTADVLMTFDLPLEFNAWVTRMATPELSVRAIKWLFDGASDEIKIEFQTPVTVPDDEEFTFVIPGAVMMGRR